LRFTVPVSDAPPVTVEGTSVTDWIQSGGGVTTTFWVEAAPTPVVTLTVAARSEVKLLVAVRIPELLFEVQPASMVKLPSLTKALTGSLVTLTLVPPTGAGVEADSVPCVNASLPPWIVEIELPFSSVMLNESSEGSGSIPPGLRVSVLVTETRLREAPPASLKLMSAHKGMFWVEATTPVGSIQLTEVALDARRSGGLQRGGTSGVVPWKLTIA
jgi:hypothetical protein